jgi:hypothetical protein
LAPGSQLLPAVGSISPNLFKTWEEWSKSSKQATSPFPIVQIGRRDIHGQKKAERIHKNMAFAPFDAFMGIKSADSSGFLDRFHALCIDDGRARLGIPSLPFAFSLSQGRKQTKLGAFQAQTAKMVEHRLPRGKVRG